MKKNQLISIIGFILLAALIALLIALDYLNKKYILNSL